MFDFIDNNGLMLECFVCVVIYMGGKNDFDVWEYLVSFIKNLSKIEEILGLG